MKKIILAVPAFALLVSSLALTGCGENGKSDKDTVSNVRKETAAHTATTNIAFVNMDTVYSQYTLAKELNAESEKYATDHQRWANNQQQSLQNSLNKLQQKVQAGQMTQTAAEEEYNQIMRRGQTLDAEGQRRATATQELIAANAKRVQDSIHNYLVDFNAENKFDALQPRARHNRPSSQRPQRSLQSTRKRRTQKRRKNSRQKITDVKTIPTHKAPSQKPGCLDF